MCKDQPYSVQLVKDIINLEKNETAEYYGIKLYVKGREFITEKNITDSYDKISGIISDLVSCDIDISHLRYVLDDIIVSQYFYNF